MEIERIGALLSNFFPIYMSRGEDPEKNKALIPTIKAWEALAKNGTYLFGTEHPTLLDVYFAPFIETLVDWRHSVMKNVVDDVDLD